MNKTDYKEKLKQKLNEVAEKIKNSDLTDQQKTDLLLSVLDTKINLMITGGTGCGKSSTINALFNQEKAKVGTRPNPETMDITSYEMDNLTIWDTPGLGDGIKDEQHKKNIINLLDKKDENGDPLIDLVLVILNGAVKEYGTDFNLINNVIIPNLGKDPEKRILVAINKADASGGGRHWNFEKNCPDDYLLKFLDDKVADAKKRIKESTKIDIDIIYYSAGYKEEGLPQEPSFNLSKLLDYILRCVPNEKRIAISKNLTKNADNFKSNDGKDNYNKNIKNSFGEAFSEFFEDSVFEGGWIGENLGKPGEIVGKAIGGVVGVVGGLFKGIFSLFGR